MPQLMTAKTVRENELTPLAKEIRRMADLANAEKRAFTAEEETQWQKVNKDYDECRKRVDQLERSDKVDEYMNSPIGDSRIGKDDFEGKKTKKSPGKDGNQAVTEETRALVIQGWMRAQLGKPLKKRHETAIEAFNRSQKRFNQKIHIQSRNLDLKLERDFANVRRKHFARAMERRNMSGVSPTAGAYTIPEGFMNNLEEAQLAFASVYDVADVMRTPGGGDLPWPTVNDTNNKGSLLSESKQLTTSVDPTFGQVIFRAYKITSGLVLVPAELLEDSAFELGSWLGTALGTRIGRIKADLFTTGNGAASPTGFVTAATLGVTAASATAIAADEIFTLKHSVDPAYRKDSSFSFNDSTLLALKKLKDAQGRYLWQAGLAGGTPDRLDDDPININQSMASIATGNKSMAYGQMKKFKIRDVGAVRLRRLVERYADFDQEGFVMFVRSDSNLLDAGTHPVKYLLHP